ncbi:MAG: hypothetical protein WD377_05830 [Nitriliruptoraceae bacterium]
MQPDEFLGERESQPGARFGVVVTFGSLHEGVEDDLEVVRIDARPVVVDLQHDVVAIVEQSYLNCR